MLINYHYELSDYLNVTNLILTHKIWAIWYDGLYFSLNSSLENSFPLFLNHLLTKLFECFASLCWIFRVCRYLSSDFYNFKFLIFCIIGYMATWPHTFVMLGGQPWIQSFRFLRIILIIKPNHDYLKPMILNRSLKGH